MERSAPLRRVTALARAQLRRTSTASQGGAHRRRSTGPDLSTTQQVMARAGGLCEIGTEVLIGHRGDEWAIHHRRPRRMGGSRRRDTNLASNLLVLCRGCHERLESNRLEALAHGWLLPADAVPAEQPVMLAAGSRVMYLRDDGTLADQPPAAEVSA